MSLPMDKGRQSNGHKYFQRASKTSSERFSYVQFRSGVQGTKTFKTYEFNYKSMLNITFVRNAPFLYPLKASEKRMVL